MSQPLGLASAAGHTFAVAFGVMSDLEAFDLEKVTRRAWSQLQTRLAVHLAAMIEDDYLVLGPDVADEYDVVPYVRFLGAGEGELLLEVPGNDNRPHPRRLTPHQEALLRQLGLTHPSAVRNSASEEDRSPSFVSLAPRSRAGRLAVIAVRVLRDVFRVPHPAFLHAPELLRKSASSGDRVQFADEPQLAVPRDHAHLEALVDDALFWVFDDVPEHDDDGDIPVVNGSTLLFVRVARGGSTVELFAEIVRNIADYDRVPFEVGVLNRDSRFVKYVLLEDRVLASMSLMANPFVPHHLRAALAIFAAEIDGVDDDLAVRVGGQRFVDAFQPTEDVELADEEEPLHPAMRTLLQLDAEAPGSVDPEQAASICDNDRSLILELITWNEEQEIAWRNTRDEALLDGDDDEAIVCDGEMRHAERTASLLRRALRHVVEQERSSRRAGSASDQDLDGGTV